MKGTDTKSLDSSVCRNCGHTAHEHQTLKPSRRRPGYYAVRGKHAYGSCKYMHGIPGFFCKCKQFEPKV